jgi:hypothetical protein
MRVNVGEFTPYGSLIIVAYVEPEYTYPGKGDQLIARLFPYVKAAIMLVTTENGIPRAYAPFQTQLLLSLLQLENLSLREIDLSVPADVDEEPPF